jgi:hypothetical protein
VSDRPPHPESVPYDDVGRDSHAVPGPSVLELLVTEVLTAVPEVRDSLLAAADALLDAARSVIDAADRVVNQQRSDPPPDR